MDGRHRSAKHRVNLLLEPMPAALYVAASAGDPNASRSAGVLSSARAAERIVRQHTNLA
jgi:hypothetical protein